MNKHTHEMINRLTSVLASHRDGQVPEACQSQSRADAEALRRISMTLHRWHELECGTDKGCIERDQKWAIDRAAWRDADRWWDGSKWGTRRNRRTYDDHDKASVASILPPDAAWRETGEKPYLTVENGNSPRLRFPISDRERGAQKRLAAIMARYPTLTAYIQGDPCGAALYILRPGDVREGASVDSCYSNGIAVYK